jgi:CHASE2 domain-containing sensor protein
MTKPGDNENNAGTVLALFALLLFGAGLLGISALVIPAFLGFIPVIGGLVLLGVFHYVTWGRWLSRKLQSDTDDEDE